MHIPSFPCQVTMLNELMTCIVSITLFIVTKKKRRDVRKWEDLILDVIGLLVLDKWQTSYHKMAFLVPKRSHDNGGGDKLKPPAHCWL